MWPIKRKSAEELDGILYFLSSALTSVIDESSYLAHHEAALPKLGAGLATAEIASRLAMFREQVRDVSEREFVIVTKLARARHWAQELRRYEPHLRADIDAFLATTARCETMARERPADAQSLFDGHAQPKRFLADRVPGGRVAAEAAVSLVSRLEAAESGKSRAEDGPSYLIGGEISVELLNEACETLLARLAAHYGWEDDTAEGLAEDELQERDRPEPSEPDDEADAVMTPSETAEAKADAEPPGEEAPDSRAEDASEERAASTEKRSEQADTTTAPEERSPAADRSSPAASG
ncbi:hypothetical protein [Dichotomicrobium thermohalophilum]|uniref:Uncharacterized protein n=1 Tax=Dichotomicrobium thermohalophilum TaxID=933063 RepID=A0A397Q576_9HYPH|nr:hypothetical protein [Dichotomicrobium thermohalophilum]RIA54955.1 hypothetical protein BXY53_0005 [Dichotomicrobium thermohalophilum]